MAHILIPEAEEILDKEYKVLNKGFIRLVDYLGGDARIVQAARVSYGSGTKTLREDRKLISYLLMNEHMSPFEQVVFTFHIKMPIFVARQWVRHRTGRINEISGRYSVLEDEFYLPQESDVRFQSSFNRQGRSVEEVSEDLKKKVVNMLEKNYSENYQVYKEMIEDNISREVARINLPLSLYTQIYWQIDLRNLLHFIKLRTDKHAQKEIRDYAEILNSIVKIVTPLTWEAFEEYFLYSTRLSRSNTEKIKQELKQKNPDLLSELGL